MGTEGGGGGGGQGGTFPAIGYQQWSNKTGAVVVASQNG